MKILVSNDDGYQAKGIRVLAAALAEIAEISVVAPDRNRSGASNSLTLDSPIRAFPSENGFISVDGTPTDCVHLAITGLLQEEPDMVVSGINAGANMGDDILYSGTVAAAMEGRFLGLPAIAVSLMCDENPRHFETAARVTVELIEKIRKNPLPSDTILNINVPDLDYNDLVGMEVTRLGHRHKSEPVIEMMDPRGKSVYWVGPCGAEADAGPETDFHAVKSGKVSITPIHTDLTKFSALDKTREWLQLP
ncbi:MAG TPA: 5'/3'-nucleotidase SurE [Gammaproteobacteria bacterium]|nr:5'/3'-nucleotidase SurE [Gammaproteobacteria bacterium]